VLGSVFLELGCVCVFGSVLESWDVYVCLGLFWRVRMGMCAWVCYLELRCVCVLGSVLESWDLCVCLALFWRVRM